MKGIFAIDGGNATGLAWGIFDETAASVEKAISGRSNSGSTTFNHRVRRQGQTIVERLMSDEEQIRFIYSGFYKFKQLCVVDRCLDPDDVLLVIEDFILSPGKHSGGRDGVASVRIAWGVVGYQMGLAREFARRHKQWHVSEPIWQAPSCQSYANDDRLKRWGLWVPGRDHERAAWKHVAFRLNKLIL